MAHFLVILIFSYIDEHWNDGFSSFDLWKAILHYKRKTFINQWLEGAEIFSDNEEIKEDMTISYISEEIQEEYEVYDSVTMFQHFRTSVAAASINVKNDINERNIRNIVTYIWSCYTFDKNGSLIIETEINNPDKRCCTAVVSKPYDVLNLVDFNIVDYKITTPMVEYVRQCPKGSMQIMRLELARRGIYTENDLKSPYNTVFRMLLANSCNLIASDLNAPQFFISESNFQEKVFSIAGLDDTISDISLELTWLEAYQMFKEMTKSTRETYIRNCLLVDNEFLREICPRKEANSLRSLALHEIDQSFTNIKCVSEEVDPLSNYISPIVRPKFDALELTTWNCLQQWKQKSET